VLEGQLLQLGRDAVHPDRAGQGRVDVVGLAGDALALLLRSDEAERAHVVQPVGQLHQQHAHVARDGQDELAQVLGLPGVLALQLQPGELGHALHQLRHLLAEQAGDLGPVGRGVLDDVVQQGGDDRRGVEPVLREDSGHLDRVGEVGVAGGAGLRSVHAHGVDVGLVEQGLVRRVVVALDALDQLVLAQVARPGGGGRSARRAASSGRRLGRLESEAF
jgi:hypothetical protein